MTIRFRLLALLALVAGGVFLGPFHAGTTAAARAPFRVGAVFPLHGMMAPLAKDEYRGVTIARDFVNAEGGIAGRPIVIDRRELETPDQIAGVMRSLRRDRVPLVLGGYSSALSIPAAAAAAKDGMVYWEAGAVADRLTGQGLATVFRVGANGTDLGTNSANFAATQLAPRLRLRPTQVRVSIVYANDAYAESVADAALRASRADGLRVVSQSLYDAYAPNWPDVIRTVAQARPDVLILASHIPDGVAFRRAMLAAHLHVRALIGSTMAECGPDFGDMLGKDAIGVFASDRPPAGFNPNALSAPARSLYDRFAREWRRETGESRPDEEGIAGFSAAWALFHDVLPRAATLDPAGIARAARSMNLPWGTLPNGAGLRFAGDRAHLGQNLRAAAVIWQWQGVRHSVVVWPRVYATGVIKFVPLPR